MPLARIMLLFLLSGMLVLSGCARRTVRFESLPAGATVSFAGQQCTTPCAMQINCAAGEARFTTADADPVDASVPACTLSSSVRYELLSKTGTTFKALSAPFLVVGIAGLYVLGDDYEDHDNSDPDLLLLTGGALVSAGVLYYSGDLIDSLKGSRDIRVEGILPTATPATPARPSALPTTLFPERLAFPASRPST